jgi:peptide chain release factor subunit 1
MAATTTSSGRLRRLTELRPEQGRVLSAYIDLDPAEFSTAPARATQITSVCDEAERLAETLEDLDHDEAMALREDIRRLRDHFDPQTMGAGGAKGIAVFACGPAGLFEVVPLPHPIGSRVVIDRTPFVDPLARSGDAERWCVVLVSARDGRVFHGDKNGLTELGNVHDDTHGQHSEGGWSQRRYEESISNEKRDHLDRVADELLVLLRRRPFDQLLIAGPEPIDKEFQQRLHPYLAERFAGTLDLDVETANADSVRAAAEPVFEMHRQARISEVLDRLRAGLGTQGGRAVAGLDATLEALTEQRVEVLVLSPGTSAPGYHDPATGMLTSHPGASPTGDELEKRDDIIETAIEKAIEQSAEVLVLDAEAPDLGPHGGIAAITRF